MEASYLVWSVTAGFGASQTTVRLFTVKAVTFRFRADSGSEREIQRMRWKKHCAT